MAGCSLGNSTIAPFLLSSGLLRGSGTVQFSLQCSSPASVFNLLRLQYALICGLCWLQRGYIHNLLLSTCVVRGQPSPGEWCRCQGAPAGCTARNSQLCNRKECTTSQKMLFSVLHRPNSVTPTDRSTSSFQFTHPGNRGSDIHGCKNLQIHQSAETAPNRLSTLILREVISR